jgi:2-dehydropantoate 2-reductase
VTEANTASRPKVCVVGLGAIGGLVAARLARVADVRAVARGATLQAVWENGLTLLQDDREIRVRVPVTDDPSTLGIQDIIFLCVKGQALPALAPTLAPLVGPGSIIVPLLNGVPWWFFAGYGGPACDLRLNSIDPGGLVSANLPPSQTVGAVVHLTATTPVPGVALLGAGNRLIIGATRDGGGEDARRVQQMLSLADFEVELSEDIRRELWYKLWGNLSFNPISALTRATADRIAGDPYVRTLCANLMAEAAAVSARFGLIIHASAEDRISVAGELGRFKTSMLQDLEGGRPLEFEPLIGAVIEIAEKLEVEVPFAKAVYGLIRLLAGSVGEVRAQVESGTE